MSEKVVRIRIDETTFKKYKVLCAELDLSIPKQTEKLIESFVKIQEKNFKLMKG